STCNSSSGFATQAIMPDTKAATGARPRHTASTRYCSPPRGLCSSAHRQMRAAERSRRLRWSSTTNVARWAAGGEGSPCRPQLVPPQEPAGAGRQPLTAGAPTQTPTPCARTRREGPNRPDHPLQQELHLVEHVAGGIWIERRTVERSLVDRPFLLDIL